MSKKLKIVILSYYRFPFIEPALEHLFAEELGRRFEIVFLLQGGGSEEECFRWHNAKVRLCKQVPLGKRFARVFNRVLQWHKLVELVKLLRSGEVGIVLVRDLPLEALLISALKQVYCFHLYFQYTAPLGDIDIEASRKEKALRRCGRFFSGLGFNLLIDKALKASDLVFPISECHRNALLPLVPKEKMVPITMGVEEDWIRRQTSSVPFLHELKSNGFLLAHFGTLSFPREPEFVLRTFAEVLKQCPRCKLLLMGTAGSAEEDREMESFCRQLEISQNVIITGQIERSLLRDYLAYCDVSICAIPPKPIYEISSPTKLYESLGCGIPVVANRGIPEQEKVVRESGCGVLVDYEEKAFAKAILGLLRDGENRRQMGDSGRRYVRQCYSYESIARRIASCFDPPTDTRNGVPWTHA